MPFEHTVYLNSVANPAPLRIVFAGTPAFAVPALNALLDAGFPPVAVLTQPDRPAGRGRTLQASAVKQAAQLAKLDVFQPTSLKHESERLWLAGLQVDLLIVVAYGLILPRTILELPRYGGWNIHPSLLPRWRGAAPVPRAIEAGDSETGVCIMQMDEGLDTGPILMQGGTSILPDDTTGTLQDRLSALGADYLVACVRRLALGDVPEAMPQSGTGVTYARKLEKADAELDWNLDALSLERKVRAFNPAPVAWSDLDGERTRIWAARAMETSSAPKPGQVVAASPEGIDISTGEGLLRLLSLQRPGGRVVSAREYLQARALEPKSTPPGSNGT